MAAAAADPSPSPPLCAAAATPSSRRLPPPCWTHDETLALIDTYRDKWFALRRGNLRASHWQEVADAVAHRSGRLPASSPKTAVQCRHKVEKLRKRYRAECQRSLSHQPSLPPSSSWVYFPKMDAMERGLSPAAPPPHSPSSSSASDDDDGDDDEDDPRARPGNGNTRSLFRLMGNGGFTVPKAVRSQIGGSRLDPAPNSSSKPLFKGYSSGIRSTGAAEEIRRRVEKRRRREREEAAEGEVAAALRVLGDGFMRVEQMKMEMAREMEKVRMEMELKRTEMVLDAQRQIVDAFVRGFLGKKHTKVSPES